MVDTRNPLHAAQKAAGTPVLIATDGSRMRLEPLNLNAGVYNEAWLQELAFDHPEILPVQDIEPGFGELCAVAREVPCAHGYIDNLFVTGQGDLVLVEAKLWRNPQARREVVAQALDYVAALTGMTYEALETACRKGQGMTAASLYGLVAERPDALAEQDFVDAVNRNLRFGRVLVIALGDGIRSETEALADLLQSHAGAHFTFALVQLATWRNPATNELIALPSTLARTTMITRGIVTVENGAAAVLPVPASAAARPTNISEELYFEALGAKDTAAPALLKAFLAKLEPLGVYGDLLASLNLKAELPGAGRATNFGYVTKTGKVWTDTLAWTAPADIARRYNELLAALIGGQVTIDSKGQSFVTTNGTSAPRVADLLPQHEGAWLAAIAEASDAIRAANQLAESNG